MKYISRIDTDYTHCWTVRIFIGKPEQVYKTFTDGRYHTVEGGWEQAKKDALFSAVKYKNKMLKKYKAIHKKYKKIQKINSKKTPYDKLLRLPLFKTSKPFLRTRVLECGKVSLCYRSTISNKYTGVKKSKSFSFKVYKGKKKALIAAINWRKEQEKLVLLEAKKRGIF